MLPSGDLEKIREVSRLSGDDAAPVQGKYRPVQGKVIRVRVRARVRVRVRARVRIYATIGLYRL